MTSLRLCITSKAFDRLGPIALVGHRGAGKSTLGRRAASALGRPFVDLDAEIEARCGISFGDDPDAFRRQESRVLSELCQHEPAPIIACGAGVDPVDDRAFVVWLDREDWQRAVADSRRPRVRPEFSERREWQWMERTRTPRYRDAAHLRLPICRGRSVDRSVRDLTTLLRWSADLATRSVPQKTWLVPTAPSDLGRAVRDAARLGMAGVELRSDIFDDRPDLPKDVDFIASLRHGDPTWLAEFSDARAWDVDIEYASGIEHSHVPKLPKRIILSTHPDGVRTADIDRLVSAQRTLPAAYDIPEENLELKFAPHLDDFDDLDTLVDLLPRIRRLAPRTTVLPTSRDFAWMRHIFAPDNAANYLPVGLRTRDPDHPTPTDLGESLPHLAGPTPTHFDALVGDPVHHSQGALWHRRASLLPRERGSGGATATSMGAADDSMPHTSYLRIPTRHEDFDDALKVLERLPIRGLSVTSPLKRKAADCPRVASPDDLPAINTLRRAPDDAEHQWEATDTDFFGMIESLEFFESRGIGPGSAIVFGRGGSTHAILRALKARNWELVAHLSAREGWHPEHRELDPVDLIVHAAGPAFNRSEHTPTASAWLDLHYVNVAAPPPDTLHLQGDLFFDAQAGAQRRFFSLR